MYRKIAAALLIASVSSALGAETLLDCSRIEDATDRVACYDKLAGRVEEKLEETYEGTTPRSELRQEMTPSPRKLSAPRSPRPSC